MDSVTAHGTVDHEEPHSGPPAPLELRNIVAGYGTSTVLYDVSLQVPAGRVVALLGANGAGKTTLLRVATGLVTPQTGQVLASGVDVTARAAFARTKGGLCLIPEGRGIFRSLTVEENIRLYCGNRSAKRGDFDAIYEVFPILGTRAKQIAGSLSGGQQQMLALSRAYLNSPRVILLDELSMGLAPIVVDEIFESFRALAATGVAMLLVEQYISRALDLADDVVLIAKGAVTHRGPARDLDETTVMQNYLGTDMDAAASGGVNAANDMRDGSAPSSGCEAEQR
jgi:branched-chain amino acid transport system ATP-binding protein